MAQNIEVMITEHDINDKIARLGMKISKEYEGKTVHLIGQNKASKTIIDSLGMHDKTEEIEKVMGGH